MGMAASQARYLALVARKSNCEYEGQQINQSRLALSNQSADLFNQMMGLVVPKTPSKSEFTYTTYTFDNGDYICTIDKWNHLSDAEGEGYNYAVTYHYEKNDNVGFQKYKYDPQIQFSLYAPTSFIDPYEQVIEIEDALRSLDELREDAEKKEAIKNRALADAKKKSSYVDTSTFSSVTATENNNQYTVTSSGSPSTTSIFKNYADLTDEEKTRLNEDLLKLINKYEIFTNSDVGVNYSNVYYDSVTQSIAFKQDLDPLVAKGDTPSLLTVYPLPKMEEIDDVVSKAVEAYNEAETKYRNAYDGVYENYNIPTKIGNTRLVPISKSSFDENQLGAIIKIINQMKKDEIDTNITKCFNTVSGEYTIDNYIGGLYTFDQASTVYYATYFDLYDSIVEGTGINNIDDQKKLPIYGTQDMVVEEEKTARALIEKDRSGRFTSIKFEDDSLVYDLKATSATDEIAYEDAMNQYAYDKSVYDKQVQDINAMTSIIQRQDQQLELRLKQLDTEQSALATEIDAVAKVVKDNIEKSFKTFSN